MDNALSGSWLPAKVESRSDNVMMATYKSSGNTMNMTAPTGESYSAKMDGTDAPMYGDSGTTSVAVKLVGKNVLEETSKLNGKVVGTSKTTVDAAGKTAKVEWDEMLSNTSGNYVMVKQ